MTCTLKQLSPCDGRAIYDMLQRIPADEKRFNDAHGKRCVAQNGPEKRWSNRAFDACAPLCRFGHEPVSINRQTQKKPVENSAGFASNFVVQSTSSMICSGRSSSTNGLRSTPLIYFIAVE